MDTSRTLTIDEYIALENAFGACDFADEDDAQLHESGAHRELYEYLVFLGFKPEKGRGPAYHMAAMLLSENRAERIKSIIKTLENSPMHGDLPEWAAWLMGEK